VAFNAFVYGVSFFMGSNGVTGNASLQMADNFSKITISSFGGAEECACCTGSKQICSACAFFF